jgi:oligopeptide/dipeptide ABC transporter ATP-binding protein
VSEPILSVLALEKSFPVARSASEVARRSPPQRVVAVDGVSFDLAFGETLGIVGESGCGKSTLARCIVRLQRPAAGAIVFRGRDLATLEGKELRSVRGRIQMVFQDPFTSLNPLLSVRSALLEAGLVYGKTTRKEGSAFVERLLELVHLPSVVAARRPRELSGGQRQRVAIARALAVQPEIVVADEATSGLDVSIQAQILTLFEELRRELDLSILFISHQLSVVAHMSDRVAVMYLGRIVELGPTEAIFADPQHPYTKGLLDSHPEPDPARKRAQPALRGELPSPLAIPAGCRVRTRCPFAQQICAEVDPPLAAAGPDHLVACHVRPFRKADVGGPASAG